MKTVPTVVASTSAVAASALGLAFVRQEIQPERRLDYEHEELGRLQQRSVSAPLLDMTATATYTLPPFETLGSSPHSFTFSAPSPYTPTEPSPNLLRKGSRERTPQFGNELDVGSSKRTLKRDMYAREGTPMSFDSARTGHEVQEASGPSQATQTTQATWLKRLSTFSSTEGSLPSSPRPPSTAISQSNGSFAFSNAGSTTPMFPSFSNAPAPPNKLVKRSSSIRSTKGSSRIPLPTFKRPATSHERDATLQEFHHRPSTATSSMPFESPRPEAAGPSWRTYFTPKVTFDVGMTSSSRRSSTSIPNPVKRIHPDRRYHPVLVSAGDNIRPVSIDFDHESRDDALPIPKTRRQSINLRVSRRFFSSPLPQRPSTASSSTSASQSKRSRPVDSLNTGSESTSIRNSQISQLQNEQAMSSPITSRRSFSPTDLPPPELPKWKRPSKVKAAEGKYRRKGTRNSLGSEASMGNRDSSGAAEIERPAKRRDVSGFSRQASIPSRDGSIRSPKVSLHEDQSMRAGSPGQTKTLQAFASDGPPTHRSPKIGTSPSYAEVNALSSPTAGSTRARPSRQSAALSEFASTFAGSDSDARYNDDDGFESPDDTLFDSVRTRATSTGSAAGIKGPRIDAIFDQSHQPQEESTSPSLDHLFQVTKFGKEPFERPRHSIIEEEESISTPVRSTHHGSVQASPETFRFGSSPPHVLGSSPPEVPTIFRRKASEEVGLGLGDEHMWDFGEEDKLPRWPLTDDQAQSGAMPHPNIIHPSLKQFPEFLTTPSKSFSDQVTDSRSNIFDWSEQQPLEKSPAGRSPPRPRTVHGKKDAENRGSRSVGRRAPSGIHVRSQSVPVAPEMDGKRSQVVTNKFGTWGVGSKGVTEDWNDDFDFEEPVPAIPAAYQQSPPQETKQPTKQREVSGSMRVPQAIQKQQENVLANIGLLRDWGLLIEELKDLRLRAGAIHLLEEPKTAVWHEVDAMIDLADQESDDLTLAPRQSPPSSPTFDMSAFDDPMPPLQIRNSPRPAPKVRAEDIFDSPSASPLRKPDVEAEQPSPRRPRKDSEAVARSVIEALQQRRNISDPTSLTTGHPSKKVPFDTATLKRIVPYVQELRDRVKKDIRDAEGLYYSPRLDRDDEPFFSRMFEGLPPPESPTMHRSTRRSDVQGDIVMSDDSASRSPPPDELSRRMELMTMG